MHDASSLTAISQAVVGIKALRYADKVIDSLAEWADPRVVSTLMLFLQTDAGPYLGYYPFPITDVPALRARAALQKLTGYRFPLRVTASRQAWARVGSTEDPKQRIRRLSESLDEAPDPLNARAIRTTHGIDILVTNSSQEALWLAHVPALMDVGCEGGGATDGREEMRGKSSFAYLKPGATTQFSLHLVPGFLQAFLLSEPRSRRIELTYPRNGNEYGINAWMGEVTVHFGPGWREIERRIQTVEEWWPNGQIKMRGQTLNGRKHGHWIYYRKDGTIEKEEGYFYGEFRFRSG